MMVDLNIVLKVLKEEQRCASVNTYGYGHLKTRIAFTEELLKYKTTEAYIEEKRLQHTYTLINIDRVLNESR